MYASSLLSPLNECPDRTLGSHRDRRESLELSRRKPAGLMVQRFSASAVIFAHTTPVRFLVHSSAHAVTQVVALSSRETTNQDLSPCGSSSTTLPQQPSQRGKRGQLRSSDPSILHPTLATQNGIHLSLAHGPRSISRDHFPTQNPNEILANHHQSSHSDPGLTIATTKFESKPTAAKDVSNRRVPQHPPRFSILPSRPRRGSSPS
jgi:hypothetical protein